MPDDSSPGDAPDDRRGDVPNDARSADAPDGSRPSDAPDDVPTVHCSTCDRSWELAYELEELHTGNRAAEQFALDHERHVGHFPDDVQPWLVDCRRCPEVEAYLEERPARRWASMHARHTRHAVELRPPDGTEPSIVEPGD